MTKTPTKLESGRRIVEGDLDAVLRQAAPAFARLTGTRLLITGGAGFLGHTLVQAVHRYNQSAAEAVALTVSDNFSRGVPAWLDGLRGAAHVRIVTHDARHPLLPEMLGFDYVMHAASIASPTYYRKDPIGTMDANINGLRNLLDHAAVRQGSDRPVRGVLFFSSSEIYGDPEPEFIPTAEDYRGRVSCTGPRACYDEAKRFGETLATAFHRQHGVAVKSARPFNNYGPGLKISDGRVIPDFARDVLGGRDIQMLSDGSATRTFCYVSDAAAGYFLALTHGAGGEAYNIGSPAPEISMRELATMIAELAGELFGYTGRVVCARSNDGDYLVDNPNRRCPVIAKAERELGFRPTVELHEGLRRSLLWYRDNQTGNDA